MLLVSVDASYSGFGKSLAATDRQARRIFTKNKVDWPNVYPPRGWKDVMATFNLGGYGLTLVDADGIVRAIDVHERDLRPLLRKLFPAPASQPAASQDSPP